MISIGIGVDSFGFETFGFGDKLPKLVADFTTGTYKASGVDKTFAEVFTFSRAGKAWLVKDTGLVGYAVDTPRFDDGLLIEQSATSYSKSASNLSLGSYTSRQASVYKTISIADPIFTQFTPLSAYPAGVPSQPEWANKVITKAIKVSDTGGNAEVSITTRDTYANSQARLRDTGEVVGVFAKYENSYLYSVVKIEPSYAGAELFYPAQFVILWGRVGNQYTSPVVDNTLGIDDFQYIVGTHESTLFGSHTNNPVTRPADYIQSPIIGTTVTGDWDSTLNLYIENGQLVHSGYGRIRSLEIN